METRQNKQAANNEFIALPIVAIVIDAIVMALAIYFGFTTSTSIFKNILFLIVIVLALVLSIGSIIVTSMYEIRKPLVGLQFYSGLSWL